MLDDSFGVLVKPVIEDSVNRVVSESNEKLIPDCSVETVLLLMSELLDNVSGGETDKVIVGNEEDSDVFIEVVNVPFNDASWKLYVCETVESAVDSPETM